MSSTFNNWHKAGKRYKTIKQPLEIVYPRKSGIGMEITARSIDNKEITFTLDEEGTKLFLMNLDKNILGKDASRKDYGLD